MNPAKHPAQDNLIHDEMSDRILLCAEQLATAEGAHTLTVRRILQTMNITNRVFYNRFRNIEEVLEILYHSMVAKIRESITPEATDSAEAFFRHVTTIVEKSLIMSYENKMQFNSYIFENDSHSQTNFEWWHKEIKKLIEYAKNQHYIRDVDADVMSYAIWCFCRGYNADAVGRALPMEHALANFRYSFGILLDGMRLPVAEEAI